MINHWKPTATISVLKERAELLKKTRDFFYARDFLEVETPILSRYTVTDPFLASFATQPTLFTPELFLQTSPEYHMKRLLAAGSGPIFQITKAFRQDESGHRHNPEFTMLEWYRPNYNHHELMDEMADFLFYIFDKKSERISYEKIFLMHLNLNPHTASLSELKNCAEQYHIEVCNLSKEEQSDKDTWLNLLMSYCIEPHLGKAHPVFIYDYPASQAALSVIHLDKNQQYSLGERFEVYYQGIELANGFHELTDAKEQRKRFMENLEKRRTLHLPELALDEYFLEALNQGFPPSSGVALGLDRLLMLALNKNHLSDIMSFSIQNA